MVCAQKKNTTGKVSGDDGGGTNLKGLVREGRKKWESKEMDPVEMREQGIKTAGQEPCHGCVSRKFRTPEEVSVAEGEQVRKQRQKSWSLSVMGPSHGKSCEDFGLDSEWDGIRLGSHQEINAREKQTPAVCPSTVLASPTSLSPGHGGFSSPSASLTLDNWGAVSAPQKQSF